MQRIANPTGSTYGRTVSVRFGRQSFDSLTEHLNQPTSDEQFAFALFTTARSADGTVCIVRDVIIPEAGDLASQSAGGVAPTEAFQAFVYLLADQRNMGIMDIHTHPFQSVPVFSSIDQRHSADNAKAICRRYPYPLTHAMIVFGRACRYHDAVFYDRSLNGFRRIDHLEILGRPIEIRPTDRNEQESTEHHEQYDRQQRVPGWNQVNQARQRVLIVGVGGNGSMVLQTLVSMGVGTHGWISIADPDIIEASNLPRIPYAVGSQCGVPKVAAAVQYAGMRHPSLPVYAYPCSVTDPVIAERAKSATIIFGCGDNDAVRKVCNEIAVRYAIPYIDLGCDFIPEDESCHGGGQIHVVLPGTNACLVCCQGYDPSAAATELMDDRDAAVQAGQGYIRGRNVQATASVANLNAITAQHAVTAFLGLLHGSPFGAWDYLNFDLETGRNIASSTSPSESCPLCGPDGILAAGDDIPETESEPPALKEVVQS